jgi:selenocysteine lyase/cysteine desulfurase
LKEEMDPKKIEAREKKLLKIGFERLEKVPNIHILADNIKHRLGVISFYIEEAHYNLVVKLLSDIYGIQVRGGCACAGTYGHYLLDVSYEKSSSITAKITSGDLSEKPGWIRLSLHQCMTNKELEYTLDAIEEIAKNHVKMAEDYSYDNKTNEFYHKSGDKITRPFLDKIFK